MGEMRYALFLGCTIPARLNNYDASARKVAQTLGIEFSHMEGAGCCGPVHIRSLDFKTSLAMSTRCLAIGERMGLDVVTLCNGCFGSLSEANHILKEDEGLRREVNELLKGEGLEYTGKQQVKHFIAMLYKDYGIDNIKPRIVKPLKGLKGAFHYGCHILRPSEVTKFDDPEKPQILDRLVEATGAECVDWPLKLRCCGAPALATNEALALSLLKRKLDDAKAAGVDCTVQICPFCEVMFDTQQLRVSQDYGVVYDLPALFYPQLLGLALGLGPDELGLNLNRVSTDKVVKTLD